MATFKHISSKNADYGAAEQYLTFEHDEFTMKPTLDENGRLILREWNFDYPQRIDVCTHPDGHNHSGNIHVHIVINSLRIVEVPFLPYMDRPADTRAGCKHRCTDAAMEYFKAEVIACARSTVKPLSTASRGSKLIM